MMPRNSNTPRTKWIVLLLLPSLLLALGTTFVRARGTAADQPKAAIPAQARIEVGQNIPVSGSHSTWAYDEVMMSMDPTNPRRGIACSIVLIPEKAKRVTVAYVTADGGTNWKPTMLTDETAESSDPVCYFGPTARRTFRPGRQALEPKSKPVCAPLRLQLAVSPFPITVLGFNPEQFTSTMRLRAFAVRGNAANH